MRRCIAVLVTLGMAAAMLFVPAGMAAADHPECADGATRCSFPTPQECAAGDHNGAWDGGTDGRGSICVSAGGAIILYTGGNANAGCGVIIVADQVVTGDPNVDPNTCP